MPGVKNRLTGSINNSNVFICCGCWCCCVCTCMIYWKQQRYNKWEHKQLVICHSLSYGAQMTVSDVFTRHDRCCLVDSTCFQLVQLAIQNSVSVIRTGETQSGTDLKGLSGAVLQWGLSISLALSNSNEVRRRQDRTIQSPHTLLLFFFLYLLIRQQGIY